MNRVQWLVGDIRQQRRLVELRALQVSRDRRQFRHARQRMIARVLHRLAQPQALATSFAAGFAFGLRKPRQKAPSRSASRLGTLMPIAVWATRWMLENARPSSPAGSAQ
jgi:hypothetical protein